MSIGINNHEGYPDPTAYAAHANIDRAERAALPGRVRNYRPLVYICSPYAGDVVGNVRNAQRYCVHAVEHDCVPIAPHLLFPQFLDDADEAQRALGLFMGYVLMTKCVEVWVFGEHISLGMAREIESAERRGMPIRYFNGDCEEVGTCGR
jgi:hypothetical protein